MEDPVTAARLELGKLEIQSKKLDTEKQSLENANLELRLRKSREFWESIHRADIQWIIFWLILAALLAATGFSIVYTVHHYHIELAEKGLHEVEVQTPQGSQTVIEPMEKK